MKKYIKAGFIGAFLSFLYPVIIAIFSESKLVELTPKGNNIKYVLIQMFLSVSIGIVSIILSILIFDNNKLSLLVASIIHMTVLFIYVLFVGYVCDWVTSLCGIILVAAGFIVIYVIIYLSNYFKMKKEVENTNKVISSKIDK